MNFNRHYNLEGRHAFLSPSKHHWINYDDEKIDISWKNHAAVERGTRLHAFAKECIELGIKLPNAGLAGKKSLNRYVNDAIAYGMTPEQPLYYSENCFGTADTICFSNNLLRIHDLKTGSTPTHINQLMAYEALFCLEYDMDPNKFDSELRIYQFDEVYIANHDPNFILTIMDKIVRFDKRINKLKAE